MLIEGWSLSDALRLIPGESLVVSGSSERLLPFRERA